MARYYDDKEGHRPWRYDQDFLSPDPPIRPLNRRRRHSRGARDEGDEERPRLQRNYHSENEAPALQTTDEWEDDQNLLGRSESRRHRQRSSKQVPSPPRFDRGWEPPSPPSQHSRKQIPSPPRPATRASPRSHHGRDFTLPVRGDYDHEVQPEGGRSNRRVTAPYAKRIPSPPDPRRKKDPRHQSHVVPETHGEVKLRLDPSAQAAMSVPFRVSPPVPITVLGSSSETRPRPKPTSMFKRVPSPTSMSRRVPYPDTSCMPSIEHQIPSPPSFSRRRHSDMDVPSTRLEHLQDTPTATDNVSPPHPTPGSVRDKTTTPRGDRLHSLQVPLSVPGSFPSPPDTILPEDSRSETSPSRRSLSGDVRSLASGSTLRHSISPSVSGTLGEKVYRYKELGAFQFRLVRILPRTMSLIKCELVHYSLEDPPSYIAISYAWGDTDDKKRIQLEGADIPVSASLHGALFALRAKKDSVLVWVDAISIDQQNRDERTQQVQLMTYIYSRAMSVAIWLGPEADDSNTAMITLSDVAAHSGSSERIKSLMSSEAGKAQSASVVALFERDYWNRLWVVQEVFNAQDIVVYCGSMALPWMVYRLASNAFWRHKVLIDYYFPGGLSHGGQRAAPTQFTFSQVLVYHGPSSIPDVSTFHGLGEESLLEVMRVCRRKLSADPKDKLYGILGLLAEDIRNEFPVDYNLSVKEVYVRVFDYLLCTTERLDVLCEAVHFPLHSGSNLPTWVPDWSHNPETTALGRSCNFSAAGSTKAVARVLDDRRRLEMSAIYLDTISCHGIAVGTLCTLADYVMAFIHWRALLLSSGEDGESQVHQEEFCRTLSLGQLPPEWKKGSWKVACYHVFASLAHERIPRLPLDEELWRYIDVNVGVKTEDRRRFLQEHFGSRMMGRCFCLTENGSIGMGSGFMAVGDTVVVPLGCPTPVLLRPEGPRGEYRYVGDVYIHGYMDGEAVDHWKSGERELRKYVLH